MSQYSSSHSHSHSGHGHYPPPSTSSRTGNGTTNYSSSTYPPPPSSATTTAKPPSSSHSHSHSHATGARGTESGAYIPSSSSYSSHRSTSSHHSNYRYHPYHGSNHSDNNYGNHGGHGSGGHHGHYSSSSYDLYPTSSSSQSHAQPPAHHGGHRYGASSSSSSSSSSRYGSSSTPNLHRYGGGSRHHHLASVGGVGGSSSSNKKEKPGRNEFGIPYGQPGSALRVPDWANISLPLFQKNFYIESSTVAELSSDEVTKWRESNDITVYGKNVPSPIRTFGEAGFPPYILSEISKSGFIKPTAIQSQGWPMAMSGRDVIGIAETGSGKTLSFLLPCIVHINAQPLLRYGDGPIVLCIAPTRELAIQIEGEVSKFASSSKIKHCCVYGGVSRREQIRNLRCGVEIIICTPGRLLDFLESSTTNLRRVTYLVIDEADRLLDMGFEPQLTAILSQVRPDRQILMWSATWPIDVRELSKKFIRSSDDALQVYVGQNIDKKIKANDNVLQIIKCISEQDKQYELMSNDINLLYKTLIFTSTKRQCDYLYNKLKLKYINNICIIHGDKQQYDRDLALSLFKSGKCQIMCATDVASRGIHIDDIKCVINYDFPSNIEDYVHRIGRTGRCGKKGTAISYFTINDSKRSIKLINILKDSKQEIPQKLIQISRQFHENNSYRSKSNKSNKYNNR